MREAIIQKLARYFLHELEKDVPIAHWRIPVEGRSFGGKNISNQLKGFADLLICYRGIFIQAEAKAPKQNQSSKQIEMEAYVRNAEGFYFVFHSLDELVLNLQEIVRRTQESYVAKRDLVCIKILKEHLQNKPQIARFLVLSQASGAASESDNAAESPVPF